eukprot:SAG31_NODE_5097_length_2746_cov_4.760106_2_plen_212_part_00
MAGATDSNGIHLVDSRQDKSIAPQLLTPNCGSAQIGGTNKPRPRIFDYIGDFDNDLIVIYESVLDRRHPNFTGMHTSTVVNNLSGGADIGGINCSLSNSHTSQTFRGVNGGRIVISGSCDLYQINAFKCLTDIICFPICPQSGGRAADGKSSAFSKKVSGYAAGCKKNALKVWKQSNVCTARCGDLFDLGNPTGMHNCIVVNSLVSLVFES